VPHLEEGQIQRYVRRHTFSELAHKVQKMASEAESLAHNNKSQGYAPLWQYSVMS
jgi:hypothetical protein